MTAILAVFAVLLPATAFSGSDVSKVKLSLLPLDLSSPVSTEALQSAGQLGGALYPTKDEKDGKKEREQNASFAKAIEAWNRHEYKKGVDLFKQYTTEFPDSPWEAESQLHVGCEAQYSGRYTEAETQFKQIIAKHGGSDHAGSRRLVNKARMRLGTLKVAQRNYGEATDLFGTLKKDSPEWRDRTYASHWIRKLSELKGNKRSQMTCGIKTIVYLLERDGRASDAKKVLATQPPSEQGHSLKDLVSLAKKYGYSFKGVRLSPDALKQLQPPVVVQVQGKDAGDVGHYWVVEKFEGSEIHFLDPQNGYRFTQSEGEFSREWDGIAIVRSTAGDFPGDVLTEQEMCSVSGGCCGLPRPEDDLGKPEDDEEDTPSSCGSPAWSINKLNMNLFVTDTPLWYSSPVGPSIEITLNYNSQSSYAFHEPFGKKWQFSYASYLVVDPSGNATVFMPDGRRDVYVKGVEGYYTSPRGVHNGLIFLNGRYELHFPDTVRFSYDLVGGGQQFFLAEIRDAHGQILTFGYDSEVRLTSITDALGRITTLNYNAQGLVTSVSDPFGRTMYCEYDAEGRLTRLTDMGGYWASFTYGQDVYLTGIEDARGKTSFNYEPADGINNNTNAYPPPGGVMWENYRITVTNPNGDNEEYYYNGLDSMSWHVKPRDYVVWGSALVNNLYNTRKTTYELDGSGRNNRINFPGGGYRAFQYDYSKNKTRITDSHGVAVDYTYDYRGNVTSVTDAHPPATTFLYSANLIDLLQESSILGTVTMTYNGTHDLASQTDRMGFVTSYGYNPYGQLTSMTDPMLVQSVFTYNDAHLLSQVTRDGQVVDSYTYDTVGRIKSHTAASGLTLVYDYDNLDRVTRVTYPDARYESRTYSDCCPRLIDSITDRSGRTTRYGYDNSKRLVETTLPDSTAVRYQYDANGNLTGLVDPAGNKTTFEVDADDRTVKKIFPDGTFRTFEYDGAGLLVATTNARGIRTSYSYDVRHNLVGKSSSDGTRVDFGYDSSDRLLQKQPVRDGLLESAPTVYAYDANSRITSVDGPLPDDTLTYQYDARGRRTGWTIGQGRQTAFSYDTLGRLVGLSLGSNTYSYQYAGASPLVQSLARPNGSTTTYERDLLNRLTTLTHRASTGDLISRYGYTYNTLDMRSGEAVTGGPAVAFGGAAEASAYNPLNQLLTSATPERAYTYDADGNMTRGYTPDGFPFSAAYDAESRLTSVEYTDGAQAVNRYQFRYDSDHFLSEAARYRDSVLQEKKSYVRDGFLPVQERDSSNAVTSEYLWGLNMGGGIGGLLHLGRSGGAEYSYLFDGKGNVSAVLDAAELVAAGYAYDPFGHLVSETGALDQPYRFSTKEVFKDIGLVYYGYRFYAPSLGRWMNRDPIGEMGGLNMYGFVENNPVNSADPLGLESLQEFRARVAEKIATLQLIESQHSVEYNEVANQLRNEIKYDLMMRKINDDIQRQLEKTKTKQGKRFIIKTKCAVLGDRA